tara:strand:+ start:377 stop:943 length:567 start_codon:yes stop_codon:yes gene_type:complete
MKRVQNVSNVNKKIETETERFHSAMLMVREFSRIDTKKQCLAFKKSYGPIRRNGKNIKNSEILSYAKHFAVALKNFDEAWLLMPSDERRGLLLRQIQAEFNVAPVTKSKVYFHISKGKQPVLRMRSDNLLATIWLTLAEMLQENRNTQKCDHCGIWFVPNERRRTASRYAFCCEDHQIKFHNQRKGRK